MLNMDQYLIVNQKFMTGEEFEEIVQKRLQKTQQLLLVKGREYRRNGNPFHNFEFGSNITGESPARVLDGFLLKHIVSYRDMLNDIDAGKCPKIEVIEEKLGDIITYFVIQEALLKDLNNKFETNKTNNND